MFSLFQLVKLGQTASRDEKGLHLDLCCYKIERFSLLSLPATLRYNVCSISYRDPKMSDIAALFATVSSFVVGLSSIIQSIQLTPFI